MNRKVYCACGYNSYAAWLTGSLDFTIVNNPDEADLLLLAGGQDIDFRFYSEHQGRHTGDPSARDQIEYELYKYFDRPDKYMLGVCRGAQFLCAMQPGGELIQDLRHPHYHNITTSDGERMSAISMHHQNAFLNKIPEDRYKLLAWAENLSPYHLNGEDKDMALGENYKEPEVVLYEDRYLGIQSHPECMPLNSRFVQYCQNLIRRYMLNEKEEEFKEPVLERKAIGYRHYDEDEYYWDAWKEV